MSSTTGQNAPADPNASTVVPPSGGAPPGCPDLLPEVGGWRAVREVGRGNMGVVYEARHEATGATGALKLVSTFGATPAEVERAAREARNMRLIYHPNVAAVLDTGTWGCYQYVVMEYLSGGTLQHCFAARGRLGGRDAVRLLLPAFGGVAACHAGRVTHRDLKPSNVLAAADGTLKVTDFGLAKHAKDRTVTATGAVMGTPVYMAPEQAYGDTRDADPAADVWALGVILYECVAGEPPFRAGCTLDLLNMIVNDDPDSLVFRAGAPPALDRIVQKCLAKDPADRYRDAGELVAALERFLAGSAPAPRAGRLGRAARWQYRRVAG